MVPAPPGASYRIEWDSVRCPGGPPTEDASATQKPTGELTECVQVPDVPGGTYHLSLFQDMFQKVSPVLPSAAVGASPPVFLSVSPGWARPGEAVTVTGTLGGPERAKPSSAWFCWGGCPGGLSYGEVPLDWRSSRTFTATLTAPEAPWVDLTTDRVVSPVLGSYELGVQCLEPAHECAFGAAEGETTVHLASSARYTCQAVPGCARLGVSPAVASPGQVVKVSGYAPVVQVSPSGQVFAGEIEGVTGGPARQGVTFSASPNEVNGAREVRVDMGGGKVRVTPAPSYAGLGYLAPLHQAIGGEPPVSANPFALSTVSWCGSGDVVVQSPNTIERVPIAPAVKAIARTGKFGKATFSRCISVTLGKPLSNGPSAVFEAFWVNSPGDFGTSDLVALYTDDDGAAWSFVPAPAGMSITDFGGFQYGPLGQVEALFGQSSATVAEVQQSADGGAHWSRGSVACPEVGACIVLGAANVTGCNMAMGYQSLVRSTDGGKRWQTIPAVRAGLPTCSLSEVVDLTRTDVLLVGAVGFTAYAGVYPVLLSRDSGASWQIVSLPALPGQPGVEWAQPSPDLVVRPDGGIIYASQPSWYLLAPGASRWCLAAGVAPKATEAFQGFPPSLTVVGTTIWWLNFGPGTSISAEHVSEMALKCR